MRHRIRISIAVAWACLGLTVTVQAALTRQEMTDLFTQANLAFRSANTQTDPSPQQQLYEKAALTYEKIILEGPLHNARLYYNLANAYLLKGDVGKAILHYRRAERLDGSDANIQKNLAFARSRRLDTIPVKTEQQVLRTLLFWHYDMTMKTRWMGACLAFGVMCLSLTMIVWRGPGRPALTTAVIACLLAGCLGGSVAVDVHQQTREVYGVITTGQIVARQGDGPNYPESFKAPLHAGTEFELIERRPRWLHIRLSDKSEGWIPNEAAEIL
jgi:tetratricopeptide (TPR) repeat protein